VGVTLDHIRGTTLHKRRGAISNAFRYGVDYMLLDMEGNANKPALFSRNRANVTSVMDRDHGGVRGQGQGAAWARQTLRDFGLDAFADAKLLLLAQPRVFGHVFNPVCFWLFFDGDEKLRVAIAEVNNTYGERHSYLCYHSDMHPIGPSDVISAKKIFHVSPFQKVSGNYKFRFDITPDRLGVWIDYRDGEKGVYTNFVGKRRAISNLSILRSLAVRPFGSLRVLGLIYYQALKLKLKGATFRAPPTPPKQEVSQ